MASFRFAENIPSAAPQILVDKTVSLRGLKPLSHEQASEILTLIDQMLWKDDMKKVLKEIIQEKAAFVQSPTRVILQHWTHFPLYLRAEDWLRLTNPSMQSQAFTVTLKEMLSLLFLS